MTSAKKFVNQLESKLPRGSEPVTWEAINSVTENPGVYAWYYRPRFTQFDRDILEKVLSEENSGEEIQKFLHKHLFRYFAETPYTATIQGALKPSYSGLLHEDRSMTPGLCQRLADDRSRREVLWDAIELMVPHFASPLYIGMAKNMRTRLVGHKRLIEGGLEKLSHNKRGGDDARRDASFATEILQRRIAVERLSVYVLELSAATRESAPDIENLLNRINYPVLGRN